MTGPEVTAAVERAARALAAPYEDQIWEHFTTDAGDALTAALDIEEMAQALVSLAGLDGLFALEASEQQWYLSQALAIRAALIGEGS